MVAEQWLPRGSKADDDRAKASARAVTAAHDAAATLAGTGAITTALAVATTAATAATGAAIAATGTGTGSTGTGEGGDGGGGGGRFRESAPLRRLTDALDQVGLRRWRGTVLSISMIVLAVRRPNLGV